MRNEPVHYWVAGIEFRANICDAVGDRILMHKHGHAHATLITRGRFRLTLDGTSRIVASAAMDGGAMPAWFEIPAGTEHEFEVVALENGCAALVCLWPGGVAG